MWFLVHAVTDAVWLLLLVSLVCLLSTSLTLLVVFLFLPSRTMTCPCSASLPTAATMQGGYRPTKRNLKYLRRYKAGKSIGFTMRSSLKAKGLIPRANGTYRVSEKYRTKNKTGGPPGRPSGGQASPQPPGRHAPSRVSEKYRTKNKTRKQNVRR
jgi:hypothetical protein